MTSIFVCPDAVKYVDFEVMNHIFCPAVPGSAACTSLAQNLMGGSCERDEMVQETLGKEAGRGREVEINEKGKKNGSAGTRRSWQMSAVAIVPSCLLLQHPKAELPGSRNGILTGRKS